MCQRPLADMTLTVCDNACGTGSYGCCNTEFHRTLGQRDIIRGHNPQCGIEETVEPKKKKVFVTAKSKHVPAEKGVIDEISELKRINEEREESILVLKETNLIIEAELQRRREENEKNQIELRELKRKLKNIKSLMKLLKQQI